ncbi:MAG TPA: hypothetical protein VLB76_15740 [Thermoanaerobaculia bacterium]|nr:hypothetical protein [Thermoanaerobaculia bacterium]
MDAPRGKGGTIDQIQGGSHAGLEGRGREELQRANGLSQRNIKDLESFYRDQQEWKAGPHLFVDDKQIWVLTPLTVSGTHSPSWNKLALGVEMRGNYEKEDFTAGCGLKMRRNAVAALATLSAILGLDPHTMRLHREDPLTTHACTRKNVRKLEIIQEVKDLIISGTPGSTRSSGGVRAS